MEAPARTLSKPHFTGVENVAVEAMSLLVLSTALCHASYSPRLSAPLSRPAPRSRVTAVDARPVSGAGTRPFIIGIGGGSASGKTTVVESIMERLSCDKVVSISQDCFYRPLSKEQIANVADYNFDHPSSMDFEEQVHVLRALQQGAESVRVPQYDFCTHSRLPSEYDITISSPEIVIFEGFLALHDARLRDMFDLSIYVDTDVDLRLLRRVKRDIRDRGRTLESVVEQYERFVKPAHDQFIEPCRKFSDLVVPFNRRNLVAIELICDHINLLRKRCAQLSEDFRDHASARSIVAERTIPNSGDQISAGKVVPTHFNL